MLLPSRPNYSSVLLNLKYIANSMDNGVHIAFVDPFASVNLLSKRLKEAGIQTSAIYTLVESPCDNDSIHPELFDHVFYVNNHADLSKIADYLGNMKVNFIYYGSELSVQVADILANILTPGFANCLSTSLARSDTFIMQETSRRHGIPGINQMKVTRFLTDEQQTEIARWTFPVIGKSINNLGINGSKVCHSVDALKSFLKEQSEVDVFGQLSFHQVLQEKLSGDEYFVDTFSMEGRHFVSGVQRFRRTLLNNQPICLYSDVVPIKSEDAMACIEAVKRVLDSIGLKNGFSHTEVVLTDKGPYVLEVNPRISGASGLNNKLFSECGFPSQVDLLIAAVKKAQMPEASQTNYGRKVYLQNYQERRLNPLNMALLYTLPSFREAVMLKRSGSIASLPRSVIDSVGFVLLAHPDQKQIDADYQKILQWEQNLELF